MAYRPYGSNGTIAETLNAMFEHKLVLPAIQREFVWDSKKVCSLFDSLMQGYTFGTFLNWEVQPQNSSKFVWYDFIRTHDVRRPHNDELPSFHNKAVTAVLDGQQRLTALNIGLMGSMTWKIPYLWWSNPAAFPTQHLYLNLLSLENNDDTMAHSDKGRYQFDFLRDDRRIRRTETEWWFKVSDVMGITTDGLVDAWIRDNIGDADGDQANKARSTLRILQRRTHEDSLIYCYSEQNQDLEAVLEIFIRLNSRGVPLSRQDLLLSMAEAQFKSLDARAGTHSLVDTLNNTGVGFAFSKEFVLKAGLMLSDINIAVKRENFTRANMETLEEHWRGVRHSLILTIQLAARFGFNRDNLRSHNALLPIAYYIHKAELASNFLNLDSYAEHRQDIKTWLIRSLLKPGIWRSGTDSMLRSLRLAMNEVDQSRFPLDELVESLAQQKKELEFTKDEIDELAEMRFGDSRIRLLLMLLFPINVDQELHIDHIFPRARFTSKALVAAGVSERKHEGYRYLMNGLANLQLLNATENLEKHGKLPSDWLNNKTFPTPERNESRQEYTRARLLQDMPDELSRFEEFYLLRRDRMKERIIQLLGDA